MSWNISSDHKEVTVELTLTVEVNHLHQVAQLEKLFAYALTLSQDDIVSKAFSVHSVLDFLEKNPLEKYDETEIIEEDEVFNNPKGCSLNSNCPCDEESVLYPQERDEF